MLCAVFVSTFLIFELLLLWVNEEVVLWFAVETTKLGPKIVCK